MMNRDKLNREALIFRYMALPSKIHKELREVITTRCTHVVNENLEVENIKLRDFGVRTYVSKKLFDVVPDSLKEEYKYKCPIKLAFYCESDEQVDYVLYNIKDWLLEDDVFMQLIKSYLKNKKTLAKVTKFVKINIDTITDYKEFENLISSYIKTL